MAHMMMCAWNLSPKPSRDRSRRTVMSLRAAWATTLWVSWGYIKDLVSKRNKHHWVWILIRFSKRVSTASLLFTIVSQPLTSKDLEVNAYFSLLLKSQWFFFYVNSFKYSRVTERLYSEQFAPAVYHWASRSTNLLYFYPEIFYVHIRKDFFPLPSLFAF